MLYTVRILVSADPVQGDTSAIILINIPIFLQLVLSLALQFKLVTLLYWAAHHFVLGAGVDFVAVTVGVLLASLLLLDDPTDIILQFIEETLLLPRSQRHVSCSGILEWFNDKKGTIDFKLTLNLPDASPQKNYTACYCQHV